MIAWVPAGSAHKEGAAFALSWRFPARPAGKNVIVFQKVFRHRAPLLPGMCLLISNLSTLRCYSICLSCLGCPIPISAAECQRVKLTLLTPAPFPPSQALCHQLPFLPRWPQPPAPCTCLLTLLGLLSGERSRCEAGECISVSVKGAWLEPG